LQKVFDAPEKEHVVALHFNLISLETFRDNFADDLALLDFCSRNARALSTEDPTRVGDKHRMLMSWREIAGRDGAMTIWDFARTTHLISTNLEKCPTLKPMVVRKNIESALAEFQRCFPHAKTIRHAAAHPADIFGTARDRQRNAFSGPYRDDKIQIDDSREIVLSGVRGRKVTVTIGGNIINYELSQASLDIIEDVKNRILEEFREASEYSLRMAVH
jgi:hypothetical protein